MRLNGGDRLKFKIRSGWPGALFGHHHHPEDQSQDLPDQEEPEQEDPEEQGKQSSPRRQRLTLQSLKQLGQMAPAEQVGSDIHTMVIIGQIEGHLILPTKNKTTKYEHIIPQLVAIEQNPRIKGLLIILNTVGGDVGESFEAYSLLGFRWRTFNWRSGGSSDRLFFYRGNGDHDDSPDQAYGDGDWSSTNL
jgi:hypothetical protein